MSVKFSGHTMGTPKCDILQAIQLFHEIGYDGIEVRVCADGQIDSEKLTDREADDLRLAAERAGIEFCCLTSYYKDFVTPEARPQTLANLRRVVDLASRLNCPNVRVYGGHDPCPAGVWFTDNWTRTVTGIRELGEYAAERGIRIVIETHIGSLTMSVRDTRRLAEDVDLPNVGLLFDYAWVEVAGVEAGALAVKAAQGRIFHCHVKDWQLSSRTPLVKKSCLLGEGTVAWREVLGELKRSGYAGYITDEYEKYWYPEELPDPEVGMKRNLEWLRKAWQEA